MSIVTELEVQADTGPEQAIEGRSQWQLTWRRLLHDKMAVISIIVILLITAAAQAAAEQAGAEQAGEDFPEGQE